MKKDKEWFIKELLGHEIGDYGNYYNGGYEDGLAYALKLAHQLDEPEKVVIPKFVAEWIEELKQDERPLYSVMSSLMNKTNHEWAVWKSANKGFSEIVAQAWLDGYRVEKEKLYYVINDAQQLMLVNVRYVVPTLADFEIVEQAGILKKYQLTEKQIKDYDERFWQFAVEVTE